MAARKETVSVRKAELDGDDFVLIPNLPKGLRGEEKEEWVETVAFQAVRHCTSCGGADRSAIRFALASNTKKCFRKTANSSDLIDSVKEGIRQLVGLPEPRPMTVRQSAASGGFSMASAYA